MSEFINSGLIYVDAESSNSFDITSEASHLPDEATKKLIEYLGVAKDMLESYDNSNSCRNCNELKRTAIKALTHAEDLMKAMIDSNTR